MLLIPRLTPFRVMMALGISAVLMAGFALTMFVLDRREKAAITAEDLFQALSQGDMVRMAECLKAKPQLANARDAKGRTPLHIAVERDLADTTLMLLNVGADPTLKNAEGKTAAEIAKEKDARAAAAVLREKAGEK